MPGTQIDFHQQEPERAITDYHSEQDILGACILTAEEMIETVTAETEILKRFEGGKLLEILPRKESLTGELLRKMAMLKRATAEDPDLKDDSRYTILKHYLQKLKLMNYSNLVIIEGSLAYFKDFLNCLYPSNYENGQKCPHGQGVYTFKGLALRKEI